MKILGIELENYGSFKGAHKFAIDNRGLVLVVGENRDEPRMNNNASGKSTLWDALDWGLFGVPPRGGPADSVVNDICDECRVHVSLVTDDGRDVKVVRSRKRGRAPDVRFEVGGVDRTTLDAAETQRRIDAELGLDREVFHATVLYGQTDVLHYAEAGEATRLEILTKILQLHPIDEGLERAKDAVVKAEGEIQKLERECGVANMEAQSSDQAAREYGHSAAQWDTDRASRLQAATRQLNEHLASIQAQQQVVAQEAQVRASLAALGSGMISQAPDESALLAAKEAENTALVNLVERRAAWDRVQREVVKVRNFGYAVCPQCNQAVPPEHLAREGDRLAAELKVLEIAGQEARTAHESRYAARRGLEQENNRLREAALIAEREAARAQAEAHIQLATINAAKAYLEKAVPHTVQLQNSMADDVNTANPWAQRLRDKLAAKEQAEQREKVLTVRLQEQRDQMAYLEFWVRGLGPKGLKNYILDNRLSEMNSAVNQWVQMITGGTFWVQFATQAVVKSTKKVANKMGLRVFHYTKTGDVVERGFESWSGGEKKRVSWAVDFGLSRMIAARATKNYDILILDEVFKHVDAAGGEAVVEMLRSIRSEKNSVFVIEQDSTFQSHFENVITIRRENGCSRIVEVLDAVDTPKPQGAPERKRLPARSPVRASRAGRARQ